MTAGTRRTMKALLTFGPGDCRLAELPAPEPGPGEIVVAMKAVGLCGSDVHGWYVGGKTAGGPVVLGHETAGVVAALGKGVTALSEGDRVFVHHHAPCGSSSCRACAAGDSVQCPEWKRSRLHPGGLAELVRVEAATVSRDTLLLPPSLGFDDGALVEPVACAVKAVDRAGIRRGDAVLVVGLGSNGVLLGLLARRAGARLLVGSDPDPARRRMALALGFDAALDPSASDLAAETSAACGGGADAVFVIPTGAAPVRSALAAAGPAARVVFYSPVSPDVTWDFAPSVPYFRDLSLRFSYSSGPSECRRALSLIEEGVVRARTLISHRLPLARAAEGFRMQEAGGEVLKVLIEI